MLTDKSLKALTNTDDTFEMYISTYHARLSAFSILTNTDDTFEMYISTYHARLSAFSIQYVNFFYAPYIQARNSKNALT